MLALVRLDWANILSRKGLHAMANHLSSDSIVALASGSPPAGVAVLRISGPAAGPLLMSLTGQSLPPARKMVLRTIADPTSGELLDRGLVVWFPGPGSFTGEDSAELHLHGGPAVVGGVLEAVLSAAEARDSGPVRLAEAGEFTRRAFENGRLDLVSVEALSDLVRAETAAQRRQALGGAAGAAQQLFAGWRSKLLKALALLEASIDFADEELPPEIEAEAATAVRDVLARVQAELAKAGAGIRLREGLLLAIIGPPNVGKSSLLNAIAGREAAIVSSIPGTTRDVVEVSLDLGGFPVTLADTAGLREAADAIEAEGVRRARGLAERADLTVLVLDGRGWPDIPADMRDIAADAALVVWSKADLIADGAQRSMDSGSGFAISSKTGFGLDALRQTLLKLARERLSGGEAAIVTRHRHWEALQNVQAVLEEWSPALEPEVQAHLIHQANRGMSRILGRSDIEDVLDLIFSEFCIGK